MKAEKLIKDYTKRCSNVLCAVEDKYGMKVVSYREWLTPDQALKAVEIEKEEVIEKACKFLKEHREEVRTEDNGIIGWIEDCFIENFKKYLEEQV